MTHLDSTTTTTGAEVILTAGQATAVVIDKTVHILKRSSSRYGLCFQNGRRLQYCCQDGCCDQGLKPDVASLVRQAKAHGAMKVIIRTGQRQYYCREIEGLPVEDVSNHSGRHFGEFLIDRAY
jgi:hypothetical protein